MMLIKSNTCIQVFLLIAFLHTGIFAGVEKGYGSNTPDTPYVPKASLDIMIGQMIMVGTSGTVSADNPLLLDALKEGKVGGIILFEKNIDSTDSPERLKRLIYDLQKASVTPLFMAIDQEGGKVNRLKPKYGFPDSRSAAWIGQLNQRDTTDKYAGSTAAMLKALGFNLNFAPVVDLGSNPDNPIIAKKERSYSADPSIVTEQAQWVIEAHRRSGVLTTLKHFPGHGSSASDTHLEMTDVTRLWKQDELIPYQRLIQQNLVDAVMTAHIVNCILDSSCNPATLSYPVVQHLLRDSLGFTGVVFSDDMQMKAITKYYGLEQSIRMAILAGVDMVLFSNNIPDSNEHQAQVVHRIIKDMVLNGTLPESRIRESYQRIIQLKIQLFPNYIFPG